jgi:hypothetical protein
MRAAVEELLSWDAERPGSWYHYGAVLAQHPRPGPDQALQPDLADCTLAWALGQLDVHSRHEELDRALELVQAHPDKVQSLLMVPAGAPVASFVLQACVAEPRRFAAWVRSTWRPFAGRARLVEAVRRQAGELVAAGDAMEAEAMARAMEDTLWDWAAERDAPREDLEAEAAALIVLRASCRRHRHDFAGARRLLDGLDTELLDDQGGLQASVEAALAQAEVAGIAEVSFPASPGDRLRWHDRLRRARAHLRSALEADPGQAECNVLAGILALCEGQDDAVATHLGTAVGALAQEPALGLLTAGVRFHAGLARLRLLEPGTDVGAYAELVAAIDGGYEPSGGDLMAAAVALAAHGSPRVDELLDRIVARAPTVPNLVELVAERAPQGGEAAVHAAEVLASVERLRLAERYAAAEAGLLGANRLRDGPGVERLMGAIEDILHRAADPALDERWAGVLASSDTLRELLGPADADIVRLEVLRNLGRVAEARGIALNLFHRAAAGSVRSFAAAELLDLLAELGYPQEQLDQLAALIDWPAPEERIDHGVPVRSVRVIFVGGREEQRRYQQRLDDELRVDYEGRVQVEWFLTGWGSHWARYADLVEAGFTATDVLVIMSLIRTHLGRRLRRSAGEHGIAWVACVGHGLASIRAAIDRAVQVAGGSARGGNA